MPLYNAVDISEPDMVNKLEHSEKVYRITKITCENGDSKVDADSLSRIDRTCQISRIQEIGQTILLRYVQDNEGKDFSNTCMLTSTVKGVDISEDERTIIISTMNSIYTLVEE